MKKFTALSVFFLYLSIYLIFSNQRITTSMDVDVIRHATDWIESGSYGSEMKLSAGVSFSPETGKFYPQEGIGIVAPAAVFVYLSDLLSKDSGFVLFTFNQVFSALSVMLMFLILAAFLSGRKAFFYASLFGLATPLFVHSKYFLPEPLTLLAITLSIYFLVRFKKEKRSLFIFFAGLSASYSLLTRPDAPLFAGIFFLLSLYMILRSEKLLLVRNTIFLILGFSVFSAVFVISNYHRYGSITETGYTLDRNEVKSALEKSIPAAYEKAVKAYQEDESSRETAILVRKFQDQQKYLEETEKILSEYGQKSTAFYTNGFMNFMHGIYLILFSPNRSVFLLSPFLLIMLISSVGSYKKFKVEFILSGIMISSYLILYALRAPLSYAGSAAWGIRYMLPVYPVLFLSAVLFERSEFSNKVNVKRIFYSLCIISVIFQLAGSGVNYQSVQMPLEYKSKQIFGEEDMTWAHESRKSMMTDFSSSLLLNNTRIMLGNLTPEQKAYGVESGPNDWFFLQVIKGEGMLLRGKEHLIGSFKLLFFLILLTLGGSAYYIYVSLFKPAAKKI
ncbi:MAG: glycosyltransferase family 39 protein [Candidatus Delongbacteria bacterium]|nr:glycosyltransferase family 39 protein [Candidatus Delongbacteria bacterium]